MCGVVELMTEERRKHGGHAVVLRAFERGEAAVTGRTMMEADAVVGRVAGDLAVSSVYGWCSVRQKMKLGKKSFR
ncbi:hypothetical protein DEO72_LG10g1848 [Vigna unguiculata]|uniref:Uncharacterized protein n=1 Tax=Vigna unguiculata TaxID=3917 RepID=A0A4D6NF97_VIGUN|nr:hypothetical protein DEO72_LG10g1848 [Vigna unguiculata]